MKLPTNNLYVNQNMDHHLITKYTKDKKTHAAINIKMFKRLGLINDQLYEVELAKTEIKQK